MTPERGAIQRALKSIVVPRLRELGFRGSFPHFRRVRGGEHQTVTFQFHKYGGSFCVEAGRIPESQFCVLQARWRASGKELLPDSLTSGHARIRHRLHAPPHGDHWYQFGETNLEIAPNHRPRPESFYTQIANEVAVDLANEVAEFFNAA